MCVCFNVFFFNGFNVVEGGRFFFLNLFEVFGFFYFFRDVVFFGFWFYLVIVCVCGVRVIISLVLLGGGV